MSEKLKKGWKTWRFDQMAFMVNDRVDNPADAGVERYVGLEHLDSDSLKIRRWGSPDDVEATKLRFQPGDIIFGRRRAYQRKLGVAEFEGICSAHAMVLRVRPEVVLPEFLPFFMQSDLFMERAKLISVGSLSPTINWKTLAAEEFILPPLDAQRRIAEVLFKQTTLIETLNVALLHLDAVQKACLDLHFPFHCGETTEMTLATLVDSGDVEFKTGPFGTVLAASEYRDKGWPIINPTDMTDGRIHHENGPCVGDETAARLQAYRLLDGDILLARKGDFSKAVQAEKEHKGWLGGSDTIRLRCLTNKLLPKYLHLCIQSPGAERLLRAYSHGTVMPGLNEKMLGQLKFEFIDLTEQEYVISKFGTFAARKCSLQQRVLVIRALRDHFLNQLLADGRP